MKNSNKVITIIVAALFGSGGIYGGYYTLKAQQENTTQSVQELKVDIDKAKEDIKESEKVDVEQTVTLKYIQQTLEKLNEKIDRETE